MKTKPAAKSKKPAARLKDIKPRKNPKGGESKLKDGRYTLTALANQI